MYSCPDALGWVAEHTHSWHFLQKSRPDVLLNYTGLQGLTGKRNDRVKSGVGVTISSIPLSLVFQNDPNTDNILNITFTFDRCQSSQRSSSNTSQIWLRLWSIPNTLGQNQVSLREGGINKVWALGAFCTSPVSSLYTEANEAPLEERRLKLSMHYYVKTRACTDSPAHHALHEFDRTTRDLYAPRPNGKGGMTRPPAPPIGLKVEEAMTSAEINAELVCPLRTPNFPPGTHHYDPKRHDLIEGVSKCMISRQEAQAKFNEFREALGSHDEVYTDGSKMNERVGAAAVINRHFQNGETTCRQLSKRLPDNSTIFAAEATAISLALNYYQHMDPVHHDVVVYSDSMSCLQAIEGEDTENPFICHIMNLLWSLSDKGTRVRFCWVPSHCHPSDSDAGGIPPSIKHGDELCARNLFMLVFFVE